MNTPTNSEAASDLPDTQENPAPQPDSAASDVSELDQSLEAQREGEFDVSSDAASEVDATSEAEGASELNVDDEAVPEARAQSRPDGDAEVTLAGLRRNDGATIALVAGQAVTELPKDLYIPPEALEVFLETFEGPLDLLLYLIRRQNLDILEVSVAEITVQYMGYIDLMNELQLELVGEYLVMAAMLAEIKSRMLLPRPETVVDDEEDPRAELIRRLQQYERFKTASENIDAMPRLERDITIARAERPELVRQKADPDVDLRELLLALGQVLRKADMFKKHAVQMEPLTVRERMSNVLVQIRGSTEFVSFIDLFDYSEGRSGVVVTFLAILELVRESMLDIVQNEPFAPIYVRPAVGDVEGTQDETPTLEPASNDEKSDEEQAFEDDTQLDAANAASEPDTPDTPE